MINAFNLIWIIPVCIVVGALAMGFFVSVGKSNRECDIYEEGVREGERRALLGFKSKNND